MKGALMGALGLKPGAEDMPAAVEPAIDEDEAAGEVEPNELELAAATEFQKAARTGSPADLVRAFRGLMSACEAEYEED